MKELIPYAQRMIGTEIVPTVDGRDIHSFLGVTKPYATWVKRQIQRAHLLEDRDYVVFYHKGENPQGGRPAVDFHFTFDASKHVAMLSNAAKGHEVREYFLDCERQLQAQAAASPSMRIPQTRYADTQAIISLALSVDETRKLAEDARDAAEDARSKAVLALQGQQWVTIRQYMTIYNLVRQLPPGVQRDYGRWLASLCRERGIPAYQQHSVDGWEEQTYPMATIQETLGGWLARRHGQGTLTVVQ